MKPEDQRQLYQLLRLYQMTNCTHSTRLWNLCEDLLIHLRPTYYSQNQEQER